MDHYKIKNLKDNHPSFRLLNANNSPLIISFLYQQFKENNILEISKDNLESNLSNYIYFLNQQEDIDLYHRTPAEYINEWTNSGFLGSHYSSDDMIILELTHYTEKALDWVKSLIETRNFVGTESRLLKIISTLRELAYESSEDSTERLKDLKKQKQEIEFEIEKVEAGIANTLTGTQIRERYFDTCQTINDMLTDFKEIEYNFRSLDMETRKKLIQENVQKGEILDDVFSSEDNIRNSDQGKSLETFWNLLQSQEQLEELEKLIDMTLDIQQIEDIKQQDSILEDMVIKLSRAGAKVQKVNHSLAEQLSRFLDNRAYLENKRIMDLLNNIKSIAFEIKDTPPTETNFLEITSKAEIEMIMNRPLWIPKTTTKLRKEEIIIGLPNDANASELYTQFNIDKKEIEKRIQDSLGNTSQIPLKAIIETFPIKRGMEELLAYIEIASNNEKTVINEDLLEIMIISNMITQKQYRIQIPQIIFCRS
ncbi:DUF3375 domain-containing protein [Methanolobus sp. WCC1]|uniref:DUF3375 domain-containing protein n=1 Tax=unclassified Methanolobus TaxID=2629569 RepID=UPI00324AE71C